MRATAACLPVCLSPILLLIVVAGAGRSLGGEAPAAGRTVQVAAAVGEVAIYLPAGHDPARTWPLLALLPGQAQGAEDAFSPWKKMADACGIVLAAPIPTPGKPDPTRGFDDLTVLSTVRAGLHAANCDPDRTALIGQGAGGYGASAIAVSYPRLARAVVVIGIVPAPIRQAPALLERTPARLVLIGDAEKLEKAREWRKARPEEKAIEVAELKGAEREISAAVVKRVIGWLADRFEFGGLKPSTASAPARDAKGSAAELAEAGSLTAAGAEAGAYIRSLRAVRLDPASSAARLSLARLCLSGGRLEEALDSAREAARLAPGDPGAHLLAGAALLRLGRAGEARAEYQAAGASGAACVEEVGKRLASFKPGGAELARANFRKAVEALAAGDFAAAAQLSRAAVGSAPAESACRVLAVCAVGNAEGLAAARRELDDYLAMLPGDGKIRALAAALDVTAGTDYADELRPAEVRVPAGRMLSSGPGSSLLALLAAKAGLGADEEQLAADLAGVGADRDLRAGLPLLASKGVAVHVGRGSLDDLRAKLAGGVPVLVQMPQGELAGLGANERYTSGIPRLVVGYDDRAKHLLVQDYGARKPLAVPYALFDLLWKSLDRWWLTVTPKNRPLPGDAGGLTGLELAAGRALGGDFEGALKDLTAAGGGGEDEGEDQALRRRLARGMVLWRLGRNDEARKELAGPAGGGAEHALQACLVMGAIDEQAGGPMPGRLEKALALYRRAWGLDPGSEMATLSLAMALARRGAPGDADEARGLLEDLLRIRPTSMPALLLLYSI